MAISNPQDLIARYLQAVSFWLPRAQRQDIAAELAADIQSQIDYREAALDRPITVPEVEELLRRRGAPILAEIVGYGRRTVTEKGCRDTVAVLLMALMTMSE